MSRLEQVERQIYDEYHKPRPDENKLTLLWREFDVLIVEERNAEFGF